jgi:hypothetical protein
MMSGEEFVISDEVIGSLPTLMMKQIAIDKQANKVYVPYGNQKSYYLPIGMVGPTVKIVGYINDASYWDDVYTNDYLTVEEFGYPTYSRTLSVDSEWWIDNISFDAKTGYVHNGKIRYDLEMDIYLKTDV